jgi:alpha-ketoglutarate-dependent taurine dioxygenase
MRSTVQDVRREQGAPPLVHVPRLEGVDEAAAWMAGARAFVREEVLRSGCLVLRGLPVAVPGDFALLRDEVMGEKATYKEKATPRSDFGDGVYSSTDLPPAQAIRLHNENSYTLDFPGLLLFCCLTAPEQGGVTTVGDMRAMYASVPRELRDRFESQGWILTRNYSDFAGMPWRKAFATEDRSEVERYCEQNLIGYEWLDGDRLRTWQRRPAVIRHPTTGEKVWFNHVAFWSRWSLDEDVREVLIDSYGEDGLPFDTSFGDGAALSDGEAAALNDAYVAVTLRSTWQPGDLLLVDNILCAHGRDAFQGERKILVAMGEPVALTDCAPSVRPAAAAAGV